MPQNTTTIQSQPRFSGTSNDYYKLPVTDKQLRYARRISTGSGVALPWEAQQDRHRLSRWIDTYKDAIHNNRFANYPTSKQVVFAERLAHQKHRHVPQECFRDRTLMSRWIDSNR